MQFIRSSRKRAGTSTNATPQDPARRIRLETSTEVSRDDQNSKVNTWLHGHGTPPNVPTTNPIPIPICDNYTPKHVTPPTPCSSPEPRGPPHCQAGLDSFGYPIDVQHKKPGYSASHQRNEFPFPIQPLPRQLRNVRLEVTIPEEPADFDIEVPAGEDKTERPRVHPLPTPPRSHPSGPTCFSHSPPSSSYEQPPPPTPSSTAPSSGLPSLSSSYSPPTPKTPCTPLTRFNSAANALKLVLMANDIGMSLQELEELNEFAAAPESGGCSKRAGRVLVRKDVQQRREKEKNNGDRGIWATGQSPFHRREECRFENCGRHTAPGMWRDIDWSRFSDTSDDEISMSDVNVGHDGDGDEEMTALDGYIKMAADADADADNEVRRSAGIMNKAAWGTAEVSRRVRPAELCMKTSIATVEAAIGPMGERVWPE